MQELTWMYVVQVYTTIPNQTEPNHPDQFGCGSAQLRLHCVWKAVRTMVNHAGSVIGASVKAV